MSQKLVADINAGIGAMEKQSDNGKYDIQKANAIVTLYKAIMEFTFYKTTEDNFPWKMEYRTEVDISKSLDSYLNEQVFLRESGPNGDGRWRKLKEDDPEFKRFYRYGVEGQYLIPRS